MNKSQEDYKKRSTGKSKVNRKTIKALKELYIKNDRLPKSYIINDFQKIRHWNKLNNLDEIKDLLIELRDRDIIYYGSIIINSSPDGEEIIPPVVISSVKFTDYGVKYINDNQFKSFFKNYYLEILSGLVLALGASLLI